MKFFWTAFLGVCLASTAFAADHDSVIRKDLRRPVASENDQVSVPFTVTLSQNGRQVAQSSIKLQVMDNKRYQEVTIDNYLVRVWLFQKSDGTFRVSIAAWDKSQPSRLPLAPHARAIPPGRSVGSISNAGQEPKFLEDLNARGEIRDGLKLLQFTANAH